MANAQKAAAQKPKAKPNQTKPAKMSRNAQRALDITKRLFAAATGATDLYLSSKKIGGALALGATSAVDGPAALATGTAAAYLGINGTGQGLSGAGNLLYAATGNTDAEEGAQLMTAMTTVSGSITMVKTGDVSLAAMVGNTENMVVGLSESIHHDTGLFEVVNSSVEWMLNYVSHEEQ